MIETYGLESILVEGTILNALLTIMSSAGNVIFDNLPLIFAVGVAIGMAKKEKEVAALAAMISFFVMHICINAMLEIRYLSFLEHIPINCEVFCNKMNCKR